MRRRLRLARDRLEWLWRALRRFDRRLDPTGAAEIGDRIRDFRVDAMLPVWLAFGMFAVSVHIRTALLAFAAAPVAASAPPAAAPAAAFSVGLAAALLFAAL